MRVSFVTRLLDFIVPRRCAACGCRLSATEEDICTVCLTHLPRTDYQSDLTANPMAKNFWGLAPIERAAALFFYHSHSQTSHLIYSLKYYGQPHVAYTLGRIAAAEYADSELFSDIDFIVPMPLSRKRKRQRGYNQSEEIARGIGSATGIPVLTDAVRRTTFVKSQTMLIRWERMENVEGMFRLGSGAERLRNKHVLIVDDVVTSGATVISCANTLSHIEGITFSVFSLGFTKK